MFSISSQLDSIFFRSNQPMSEPEPTNECQHRQISCGPWSGKYNVRWNQSIFDRLIPTATKGKNEIAIYLKNGQKFAFPYASYSTASWESVERSHFWASIYANVLKTNKGFYMRIRFNSHRIGLHCLRCLQVAITAPERGPITHPAQEGWPHHRGLLPLLLSIEQWCGLFYVPQEPSGSAVRRDLRFTLLILGYTPEWVLFHCFGTPVSGEHNVISKRSISDPTNRLKEQNCCWHYFYFCFKDLINIKLFISGKSK